MLFKIDVRQNILSQFASTLGLDPNSNDISLESPIGKGRIRRKAFPGRLELYHFQFELLQEVSISSENPADSEWILFNINLSGTELEKTVNDHEMAFQRYLPSGILIYTPQTEVYSTSQISIPFEIVLVRMHRTLLEDYWAEELQMLLEIDQAVLYEDLEYQQEALLETALSEIQQKVKAHMALLDFLSQTIEKLKKRSLDHQYDQIHPEDLKGLFLAAAHLRNPHQNEVPGIQELAQIAGMGNTKFKTSFKQVFGSPPIKYHLQIKMDYARTALLEGQKSPTELSYELGYSHPSKFTLAFKKHFGITPSSI